MPTDAEIRTELEAAIYDNADYDEDGSLAKAKTYRTALRRWLDKFGFDEAEAGQGGSRMRMEGECKSRRAALAAVSEWIAAQPATSVASQYAGYQLIDISGGRNG